MALVAAAAIGAAGIAARAAASAAPAAVAAATGAAPAATGAVAASAATPARSALLPRLGFIHGQGPALVIVIVQLLDGLLRLRVVFHLHEAEAARASGLAVGNHLSAA